MKKTLFLVFAASVLGGCASAETATPEADREEVIYRTGTNIPSKQRAGDADGVKSYDKEAAERMRQQENASMPRPATSGSRPGG
jgi:hypothetical protein